MKNRLVQLIWEGLTRMAPARFGYRDKKAFAVSLLLSLVSGVVQSWAYTTGLLVTGVATFFITRLLINKEETEDEFDD